MNVLRAARAALFVLKPCGVRVHVSMREHTACMMWILHTIWHTVIQSFSGCICWCAGHCIAACMTGAATFFAHSCVMQASEKALQAHQEFQHRQPCLLQETHRCKTGHGFLQDTWMFSLIAHIPGPPRHTSVLQVCHTQGVCIIKRIAYSTISVCWTMCISI